MGRLDSPPPWMPPKTQISATAGTESDAYNALGAVPAPDLARITTV